MTVFNDDNKLKVDCSEATIIPFNFKIFKDTDLKVSLINRLTLEETALELNVDYTVEISRIEDGGNIILTQTHSDCDLSAYRQIEIIQPQDVPTEGNFPEKSIENAFDRSIMIDQQLQEQINRSIKIPVFSEVSEINFDTPIDGKAVFWDVQDGKATLKNANTNPDEVYVNCDTIKSECDSIKSQCNTLKDQISDIIEAATGVLPAMVNLTTWARLNDGNIYNIPFDDIKADSNRFIIFKNTEDRRTLTIKKNTFIRLETSTNVRHLCVWEDTDLDVESLLDTGETLTNGKDYSIFLVPNGDNGVALKVSLNKTAPVGYNTEDTRRIGGFHTLCVSAGTISGHDLSGWLAGDILPLSVWTLWHKPAVASPSGMRYVPERDGWKTIYMQSGTGKNTVFEYGATHTRSRDYWGHEFDVGMVGLELISSINFTIAAQGVEPLKAIQGKAESYCLTAGGHVNESGRRILSNGGDEDDVGVLWQVLSHVSATGATSTVWNKAGSYNDTYAWQAHNVHRLIAGGIWDSSGYTGPSCRYGSDSALNLVAYVGARGWSRPYRPCA